MSEEQLNKLISKIGLCTWIISIEIIIGWMVVVHAVSANGKF